MDWSYRLLLQRGARLVPQALCVRGGLRARGRRGGAAQEEASGRTKFWTSWSSLVDKSLVDVRGAPGRGGALPASGDGKAVRPRADWRRTEKLGMLEERHAEHLPGLGRRGRAGTERTASMDRAAGAEHANFRSALSWALDRQDEHSGGRAELGLALAAALAQGRFWNAFGPSEARGGSRKDSPRPQPSLTPVRAKALREAGWIATHQGDYEQAVSLLEESRSLFERSGTDRA